LRASGTQAVLAQAKLASKPQDGAGSAAGQSCGTGWVPDPGTRGCMAVKQNGQSRPPHGKRKNAGGAQIYDVVDARKRQRKEIKAKRRDKSTNAMTEARGRAAQTRHGRARPGNCYVGETVREISRSERKSEREFRRGNETGMNQRALRSGASPTRSAVRPSVSCTWLEISL
jgi:hypothetical protein